MSWHSRGKYRPAPARRGAVLLLALGLDALLGEPPTPLHPVAWFGRLTSWAERRVPRGGPKADFPSGLTLTLVLVGAASGIGWAASRLLREALASPLAPLAVLAEAWCLKTMLSARALFDSADRVRAALDRGSLDEARAALGSLVSRDTNGLGASLLAAAAIESVAENASDSILAPALAYLGLGLPGAAAYRAINTLDAMIGYRGDYEWFGKCAARLDDLANLIPARTTAVLIACAAVPRGSGGSALRLAARDHGRTASPNAGWPMSAMAGALGVELQKVGQYRLGAGLGAPAAADVVEANRLVRRAIALGALAVALWMARALWPSPFARVGALRALP